MEDRISILCEEIRHVRSQYVDEVGIGGRKVWPKAIKSRALEVCELIGSVTMAAERMGLPKETLYVWRAKARGQESQKFKSLAVVDKSIDCATVTVAQNLATVTNATIAQPAVTITTPKGYLIEGLPASVAIELLVRLGKNAL